MSVVRVAPGATFNIKTWSGVGLKYTISVTAGTMSVEGNNEIY